MSTTEQNLLEMKKTGNHHYKLGEYTEAITIYETAIAMIEKSDTTEKKLTHILCTLEFNIGQCYFSLCDFSSAITFFDRVIEKDKAYSKALFKKAIALEKVNDNLGAIEILSYLKSTSIVKLPYYSESLKRIKLKIFYGFGSRQIFEKLISNLASYIQSKKIENFYLEMKVNFLISNIPQNILPELIIDEEEIKILLDTVFQKKIKEKTREKIFRLLVTINKLRETNFSDSFVDNLVEHMKCIKGGKYFMDVSYDAFIIILDHCFINGQTEKFISLYKAITSTASFSYEDSAVFNSLIKALTIININAEKNKINFIDCILDLIFENKCFSPRKPDSFDLVVKLMASCVYFSPRKAERNAEASVAEDEEFNQKLKEEYFAKSKRTVLKLFESSSFKKKLEAIDALYLIFKSTPAVGNEIIKEHNILNAVLESALDRNSPQCIRSIELLALGSSHQSVRQAIISSKIHLLFMELFNANLSDESNALSFLALAKFALASEEVREFFCQHAVGEKRALSFAFKQMLRTLKKLNKNEMKENGENINFKIASLLIEGLSYLAILVEIKQQICLSDNGKILDEIVVLFKKFTRGNIIRHGIAQIFFHFSMCDKDYNTLFVENAEIEKLKKVTQKGLYDAQKGPGWIKEEFEEKAGSHEELKEIRRTLARKGVLSCLREHYKIKARSLSLNGSDDSADPYEKKSLSGEGSAPEVHPHFSPQSPFSSLNRSVLAVAYNLAIEAENRGMLIQQGVLPLLLSISQQSHDPQIKIVASSALSRLLITTNPALVPEEHVLECARVIIEGLKLTGHELNHFEGMMALTNIASLDGDIRDKLVLNGAWSAAKEELFSENFQLQRSAVELFCNLIQSSTGLEKIRKNTQEVKIFYFFCKSEDVPTIIAAISILALLSFPENFLLDAIDMDKNLFESLKRHNNTRVREVAQILLENIVRHENNK